MVLEEVGKKKLVKMFETMVRIRTFEERVPREFAAGEYSRNSSSILGGGGGCHRCLCFPKPRRLYHQHSSWSWALDC